MKYIEPKIMLKAFHCPLCGIYAHMEWSWLRNWHSDARSPYLEATCSHCKNASMWRSLETKNNGGYIYSEKGEMLFPDYGLAPLPEPDMPEDVAADYVEAANIFSRSPRGAAALLRLGLQKLCKHLGEKGKNINEDIRALAAKNILPPQIVNVADTVRIVGNNAVHPGEMSDEDFDHVASKMFFLLNMVVKKAISEPAELKMLYEMTPEAPRQSAEEKDSKTRV